MCESHTPTERERQTQPSDAAMASTPGAQRYRVGRLEEEKKKDWKFF